MSCITGGVEPEFKKKKKKSLSKSEVEALSTLTATGVHSGTGAFVVVHNGPETLQAHWFCPDPNMAHVMFEKTKRTHSNLEDGLRFH